MNATPAPPGLLVLVPYHWGMSALAEQLRNECIRRLDEGEERIVRCIGMLSEHQVWHRPNTNVASVGNLVLHLCGNVGQWINSTLGGMDDRRERDLEFQRTGLPLPELLALLRATLAGARLVIARTTPEAMEKTWRVQGFEETGTAILVHVAEHFSYHVGQITLHTKLMLDVDTGYYAGKDLNAKG